MKRLVLLAIGPALLAGCGAREPLAPPPGTPLPVAPYAAKKAPTGTELLNPPPQTRPARSDDLLDSTDARRSDEYDLPPPN